ncbi:SgcJ/EcaC family oxidoreductase [Kribbella sp. DT2]|uniref:SgcJ/EcaC family oxidoreductase n=1 Tax=Kribbella sp. DT2 TaxID=3393427 RepID=UPI003CF1EA40
MTDTTRGELEVRQVLDRLAESWNRGDATAYGENFTEDATYVTFVGTVYRGRADIAAGHAALFGKFLKGTKLYSEVLDVRLYGERAAIVVTRGDVAKKKPATLAKVQTYTLVREGDGRWRIAAFHNTKHARLMEAVSFRFLPASAPLATR